MMIKALAEIQNALKSPKDQNAGRYRYRNIEDINQAVKPLALEHGCAVIYTDEYRDGVCISTCSLVSDDGEIHAQGFAAVNTSTKNMSIEQACGAASSYARKYAACGLFAIDSSENDPDRVNAQQNQKQPSKRNTKPLSELDKALMRLRDAEQKFCIKNAEMVKSKGITTVKQFHEQVTAQREDYSETVETLNRITDELIECLGGE